MKIIADIKSLPGSGNATLRFFRYLLFDSGFRLLFLHRLVSWLYKRRWGGLIALYLNEWVIFLTGCHVSPKAAIDIGVRFPHPVGLVIGDGVFVGRGCQIYQNVTLGQGKGRMTGYPRLGVGVVVYPGAVIVGDVDIGDEVVIGANCYVEKSVSAKKIVKAMTFYD